MRSPFLSPSYCFLCVCLHFTRMAVSHTFFSLFCFLFHCNVFATSSFSSSAPPPGRTLFFFVTFRVLLPLLLLLLFHWIRWLCTVILTTYHRINYNNSVSLLWFCRWLFSSLPCLSFNRFYLCRNLLCDAWIVKWIDFVYQPNHDDERYEMWRGTRRQVLNDRWKEEEILLLDGTIWRNMYKIVWTRYTQSSTSSSSSSRHYMVCNGVIMLTDWPTPE